MESFTKIVIVGATSSIAEHCARLWLENKKSNVTLIGRDSGRLERVAVDLRVRSPQSQVQILQADFLDPRSIRSTIDHIASESGIDLALIAHGSLPDQTACQENLELVRQTLDINAISPVLYAEAIAKTMAKNGRGTLVIIGSVAGDRGRKSNYVYGAAKGLIERYTQGLQHRFAGSNIQVILVKPGPTLTPMTANFSHIKLAPVTEVAATIVAGVARNQPVIYAPRKWQLIMMIIRHLPKFVFDKMNI